MFNKPHRDTQSAKTDFTASSARILQEYFENNATANEKYLSADGDSKILEITRTVSKISEDFDGLAVVLLKNENDKAGVSFAVDGEANYRISGNLTIKDITQSLAFNSIVNHVEGGIDTYADFDFDRLLYDVRFGSGRYFDNLRDNLINDNINLKINLVARY
ncbi:MAG: YceI family protein [Lentimicrobium sp.]|nr:YceI family protein [Lentimicrobium sp.]